MFDFDERVVLITGAGGFLGQATVRAFLPTRASLILVDRDMERLEERFPELEETTAHLLAAADLTDAGAVEGLVYEAMQQYTHLDAVVNIAGGFMSGQAVHETPADRWQQMMDLNFGTALNMARAAVPFMLEQGAGSIVNIGGQIGLKGRARMAPYAVSKSAVIRLTESLSAELSSQGINVNCILPQTIDTPANRSAMPRANFKRWASPEAIADLILFLCSEHAAALHGAAIPVSGPG